MWIHWLLGNRLIFSRRYSETIRNRVFLAVFTSCNWFAKALRPSWGVARHISHVFWSTVSVTDSTSDWLTNNFEVLQFDRFIRFNLLPFQSLILCFYAIHILSIYCRSFRQAFFLRNASFDRNWNISIWEEKIMETSQDTTTFLKSKR